MAFPDRSHNKRKYQPEACQRKAPRCWGLGASGPPRIWARNASGLCYPRRIEERLRKRLLLAVALLILSAAAAVRLGGLDRSSYWLDEVFESFTVHGSWGFLWSQVRRDAVHPPLDYAVVKCFEALRPTDAQRKIPAALWGIGAVAATGWLLRRRAGTAAAILALALLALSPVHVRYSQELRPYSLGIFLLVASLCALELWMERRSAGRAALLFLLALATAYSLTLAAVVLAVAGAGLALEDAFSAEPERRAAARELWKWSPLFVLGLAAAYAPWIPVFARGVRSLGQGYGRTTTISSAGHMLSELTLSYKYGGFSFGPPRLYHGVFALALALVVLGAVVSLARPRLRFLPMWAGGGLLAVEILRQRSPGHFASRYFLPAGIALPCLAAIGLAELFSRRRLRAPAAAALFALLVMECASVGLYFQDGRADWRPLARFLSRSKDRPVFTDNENSRMCLAYFLCGPGWLARGGTCDESITNMRGSLAPLEARLRMGAPSWLVLSGMPSGLELRRWSKGFRSISFPEAEGVVVRKIQLRPDRNHSAVAAIPSPSGT